LYICIVWFLISSLTLSDRSKHNMYRNTIDLIKKLCIKLANKTFFISGCAVKKPLRSSTCFKHYMLIIRRLRFIDAASGIVRSVSSRPVHRLKENL
jgi:hypothetical protein